MPFPEEFNPEDYAAFAFHKLVRTGIATDTWNRGGYVQAIMLESAPLLPTLAAKMVEELEEVGKAFHHGKVPEITEELADVLEAISLAKTCLQLEELAEKRGSVSRAGLALLRLVTEWKGLSSQRAQRQNFVGVLMFTQTLVHRLALMRSISKEELQQAFTTKREEKGPLEGLFLKALLLPKNDEKVPLLAAKGRLISVAEFNWNEVLTPAHLLKAA